MGIQGPLTAQALGRSPYDDVVDGEGEDDPRQPPQEYDQRGRPVNPETKRMNRDIIRAHNEVMLVIGVAEPENPQANTDAELRRRHWDYETSIGLRIDHISRRCVEAVGIFGLHSLRQRMMIYKHYSETPFWKLFQNARTEFSITKNVLPGAPASLFTNVVEEHVARLWRFQKDKAVARRIVHEIWSYLRVHLELFVALQRVGLIPTTQWLPRPSYFIPFSHLSPIPCPPVSEYPNPSLSLLRLGVDVLISAAPFIFWVMLQRLARDWRQRIWSEIFWRLAAMISPSMANIPAPASSLPQGDRSALPAMDEVQSDRGDAAGVLNDTRDTGNAPEVATEPPPIEAVRRPSLFSVRGDEYASEEDEHEGLSAALITFDVEEATDAPAGLWSAELRPSQGPDASSSANTQALYFNTLLRQLPVRLAARIFTDALLRLLIAPYEAAALRLAAKAFRAEHNLICPEIYDLSPLKGLNWTSTINFLGVELLHLSLLSDVWALCTSTTQYFYMSDEDWKAYCNRQDGEGV